MSQIFLHRLSSTIKPWNTFLVGFLLEDQFVVFRELSWAQLLIGRLLSPLHTQTWSSSAWMWVLFLFWFVFFKCITFIQAWVAGGEVVENKTFTLTQIKTFVKHLVFRTLPHRLWACSKICTCLVFCCSLGLAFAWVVCCLCFFHPVGSRWLQRRTIVVPARPFLFVLNWIPRWVSSDFTLWQFGRLQQNRAVWLEEGYHSRYWISVNSSNSM